MTLIAVEQAADRDLPQLRLTPGLMQPRLITRSAGGRAHVAIVAGGAALLGGDAVSIRIRVGPGCSLLIEDIGGT
ncbi:urease accessory protein, partial [Burkholderia multivorans]